MAYFFSRILLSTVFGSVPFAGTMSPALRPKFVPAQNIELKLFASFVFDSLAIEYSVSYNESI